MRRWVYRLFARPPARRKPPEPSRAAPKDQLVQAWTSYFREDYAEAIACFAAVVDGQREEIHEAQARLGIGLCWEDLGRPERARAAFAALLDRFPGSGLRDLALQGIARCRERRAPDPSVLLAQPLRALLADVDPN